MDVFDLVAKLRLDSSEYENSLGQSKDKASSFAGSIGGALGTAAKVGAAALTAASTAAAALTKQAIDGYKEYEQLVGGVDTLFGESSAAVQANAAKAFETAGLSANEYMSTVTSFSASLLQSLDGDTAAAAQYADMAIRDMSDNANKMGTSMDSIQNAYQGFAKQNYTMLDNLKLGYGGTKSEMERLVADAEKLDSSFKAQRDSSGNLALSYSDVVDAIHIVQTEMGITGTTAEEASTTIEGSVNAMKAAWSNLVAGLATDGADIGQLVDNLVTTIIGENGEGGVLNNILPAVARALNGIMQLVTTIVPKLVPIIVDVIVSNLPMLIDAGLQILIALIGGLAQALPQLIAAIPEIIRVIVNGLAAAWPEIKAAGLQLGQQLWDGLSGLISDAWNWGADLIGNFISGIMARANELWDSVRGIAQGVRNFLGFSEPKEGPLSDFHTYAPDMMELFAKGIRDNKDMLQDTVADAFDFGSTTIESAGNVNTGSSQFRDEPVKIVVQSVLDGKIIAENTTLWQRRGARALA